MLSTKGMKQVITLALCLIISSTSIGQRDAYELLPYQRGLNHLEKLTQRFLSKVKLDSTATEDARLAHAYYHGVHELVRPYRASFEVEPMTDVSLLGFLNNLNALSYERYDAFMLVAQGKSRYKASVEQLAKTIVKVNKADKYFERKVIQRNSLAVLKFITENQDGTELIIKVCADKSGEIQSSEILPESTAIILKGKEKDILEAVKGYRFEADPDALEEECGKLRIRINKRNQIQSFNGGF